MTVVGLRQHDSREEIRGDSVEEWQIVREKLRKIHVDDRAQHQDVLALLRVGELWTRGQELKLEQLVEQTNNLK